MKHNILFVIGVVGGAIATALGGWDASIINLLIMMAIDLVTGIITAAVFKKSSKTKTGALSSSVMRKGLFKKGMILVMVVVANILDRQLGIDAIRDAVCIAFTANEAISIIENAGIMGVPVPNIILNAIDLLKQKSENGGAENE